MSVQLSSFAKEEVFIDYPFEQVKFRYRRSIETAYRKFYGDKKEVETPHSDNLFRQAILNGDEITNKQYEQSN